MRPTTKLRQLLQSDRLEYLMEAHNGLSAKIVEEAGFQGIWASGLAISASLGVRDNNEASWTQVLETVEFMADATELPILLDGDTGYGNFNNMRRLVKKLEQRGVAGVCIEDKLFPKTNSFIGSERQPLADIEEFAGKIRAGKDAQNDPDFCIVARVEAFIAGWGLEEALRRAEAYREAGADAILIHSKTNTPNQVLAFKKAWGDRLPVVIVPTKYYSTPVEVFENARFSTVIWANHTVRAATAAMQWATKKIQEERSVIGVEEHIVPVKELFRLQNSEELQEAEAAYLPQRSEHTTAIVLAASQGRELESLTEGLPKVMVQVQGRPLLHRLVTKFRQTGVKDVVVVRGYEKDKVKAPDVAFVDNDDYENTGELVSLDKARAHLEGDAVISFGDILFRRHVLYNLLAEEGDIAIIADANWKNRENGDRWRDLVTASRPYSLEYSEEPVHLAKMGPDLDEDEVNGEWIGLMRTTPAGSEVIRETLDRLKTREDFKKLRFKDLFQELIKDGHDVRVHYVAGHWLDVDTLDDYAQAQRF
jgi:phosphoenolpyruvate phosphomutase